MEEEGEEVVLPASMPAKGAGPLSSDAGVAAGSSALGDFD